MLLSSGVLCIDHVFLSLGPVVPQRSDHGTSAPALMQAAASAAGAPLVASPYPQSYLQYNPQQYSQQQVIQAMTPYPGQVKSLSSFAVFELAKHSRFILCSKVHGLFLDPGVDKKLIFNFFSSLIANVFHATKWSQDDKSRWGSPSSSPWTTWRSSVPYTGRWTPRATARHLW